MCISWAEIRADEEGAVIDILCKRCLQKVDRKLREGETLFDFPKEEYGFCKACTKRIDEFFRNKEGEEDGQY